MKLEPMSAIVAATAAAAPATLAARAAAAAAAAAAAVASVGSGESKAPGRTAVAAAAGDSGGPVRADFTGWQSWPKTRQESRPEDGGIDDASGKVDMNGSGAGLPLLQASPYPCSESGAGKKNGEESSGDGTGGGGSSGTTDEEGRRLEKKQEPADPKQKVRAQTSPEQEAPEPATPKLEAPKEQVPRQQHKPFQQQPTTPEPPPQKASTPAPSNAKAPKRKDPRREPLKWNGTASRGGRASGKSGSGRTLRRTTATATRSRRNPVAAGGSAANDFAAMPPTGVRGGKPGRGFPIGGPRRAQRQAAAAAAAAATRASARTPERSPSSEKVAAGSCAASTRGKRKHQVGDGGRALPSKSPRSPGRHATALGIAAVAVLAAAAVLPPGAANTPLQMPEKMRPSSVRGSGGGGGRGGGKANEDRSGESSGSIPYAESTELEDNSGGGGKACEGRNGEGSGSVSMVEGTDVGDESAGAGAGGKSDEDRTTVEGKDPGDDPGGGGNDGLPAVVGRCSAPVGGGKAGRARRDKKNKKEGALRSPPNAAAEVRFLKSKEAHAVPLTPTPRYYLPADQGGPMIEDAAGVPATEHGDGTGGGRRFRPALSEGGADVIWDRRRFNLTVPAKLGGGGGGGGGCCCGGAAVDEATTEEAGCLSADSSLETAGSPPHGSDGGNGGHDKGKGKDPPPPRDSTPRARKKERMLTLREEQDEIFKTLVNSSRQKDLITPQEYGHAGGYFGDREQPFEVVVHPHVHFVADAHAYMMEKNEVIGWLGGWFDEENKVLYVQTAVPCREDQELSGGARGMTEVSMCQASSFHTSEAIRGRGLQLVGWYHSHPKFVNDPSPIDVENHQMFQASAKDESGEGSSGAWVGLIVGRKTSPSDFRWFRNAHVERVVRDENGDVVHTETVLCPMLLRTLLASSVMSPAATAAAAAAAAAAIASAPASTPEEETAARIEALTLETGAAALATVEATVGGGGAAAGTQAASSNTAPLPNMESARTPRAECLASHSAGHVEVCRDRRLCASGGWEEAGMLAGGTGEGVDGGGVDGAVDVSLRQQQQQQWQRQQRKRGRVVARARAATKALERAGQKSATHLVVKNLDDTLYAAATAAAAAADGGGDGDVGRAAALAPVAPTSNNGGSESPLPSYVPATVRVPANTDTNTTAAAIDAGYPPLGLPQQGSAVNGVKAPSGDVTQQAGKLGAATLDGIIAIASDPPLIMSEEALEILKGATGGGSGEGFEGYGPKMDRIVESVTSLGRYYAGVSGRASLSNGAKAGMPTLAKLAGSLAQTVQHMELDPSEADEFIHDACFFLLACFRETDVRIANQQRRVGVGKKRRGRGGGGGGGGSVANPRRRSRRNPAEVTSS
ncbi:unnamed protein product [Ectocarpus sp. CCAP 1310/34]|nr:unnamed protein product [Ectocarpus sp. CCAP 1310/34]